MSLNRMKRKTRPGARERDSRERVARALSDPPLGAGLGADRPRRARVFEGAAAQPPGEASSAFNSQRCENERDRAFHFSAIVEGHAELPRATSQTSLPHPWSAKIQVFVHEHRAALRPLASLEIGFEIALRRQLLYAWRHASASFVHAQQPFWVKPPTGRPLPMFWTSFGSPLSGGSAALSRSKSKMTKDAPTTRRRSRKSMPTGPKDQRRPTVINAASTPRPITLKRLLPVAKVPTAQHSGRVSAM